MECYCKTIFIEALTMIDMVKVEIIPACIDYQNDLIRLIKAKKSCGEYDSALENHLLGEIAKRSSCLLKKLDALENVLLESRGKNELSARADFSRERIFAIMSELRLIVDELETLVAKKYWPFPAYAQMLYSVV